MLGILPDANYAVIGPLRCISGCYSDKLYRVTIPHGWTEELETRHDFEEDQRLFEQIR